MRVLVTTYLEMRSPDQLRPKRCADNRLQIRGPKEPNWIFNRDLYFGVGEPWAWIALAPELRTFGAYYDDAVAGYYELRRDDNDRVEIGVLWFAAEVYWLRIGRSVTHQRDRGSLVDIALAFTSLGPHLQSRSPGRARQLSARGMEIYKEVYELRGGESAMGVAETGMTEKLNGAKGT